jgi:hypothetical protein
MSCGSGHLGFPIGIKNRNLVKDIPMSMNGENVSKRFFSETTWTIETKLPMNAHLKVLCSI